MTDTKLRIGFDAKRLFYNDTGLGNYSRTLIRNLLEYYPQHEYHLFSPGVGSIEVEDIVSHPSVVLHQAGASSHWWWRSFAIAKLVRKLKLDVYHGLSHEIPVNSASAGCPMIVTMHDLIYEVYPKQFKIWDTLSYKVRYRRSAKQADYIIAISNATKKDLIKQYGISTDKIAVIPQSCNTRYFDTTNPLSFHDRKHWLYVGSVIPRKRLMLFVDAYAKLDPDCQLPVVVIGSGGTYMHKVKEQVKQYGLSHLWRFEGSLSNEALISYYQQAKALIWPSIYEGFGIPIIEALSQGTPVLTTLASAMPEAAGPGGAYIEPDDVLTMTKHLATLATEPTVWQELSTAGEAYVRATYDGEVLTENLVALYEQVISTHCR